QLLDVRDTPGEQTEAGLRGDISVGIQYLASWLRGTGAVAINNLMEDAATAEISRSQVWQWLHNDVTLADSGQKVSRELVQRLTAYGCDGLTQYKGVPALVAFPHPAAECAWVVRECVAAGVPYVARGSGTGLSGGALPHADGVLVVTSQMRAILDVAPQDERAVVEPGVINLDVSRAARPFGYYYAPDPSSQQICSIGGNLAENSGGAHCLKYGF